MQNHCLLALFAHPDDEAFGSGGALARYAADGAQVALVCTTRGEVGQISDPALATRETLGAVREGELRCAAQALGIGELIFLGYRDSGMEGTPENSDPLAYMNAPSEQVVERLVGIMRRLRPQVVLTFDPQGGYGHPDHIAIHRHSVAAFHAAGDPARFPEQGPAWQPARLFYTALPRSFFEQMQAQMEAHGIDTSQFRRFEERGWPDERITVSLDVAGTLDAKWQALQCHRTQFGPDNLLRRMPEELMQQILSREHFALAWPEPERGLRMGDLFEGSLV
jgi:N-acetyl-1-D-myo-inositol-2-amino-2-deoxy-alpha-D-glucopyranoside deacetylase